ncbi:tRNA lysidine(34) synthetase TilS [Isoptericola sp. b408]|uniref:tRNA lysidine(34) synthetase TilS n=1 Tax=Isoptericola sp. b408 TaxID=3064653 RepID=UPI0027126E26|nr:tRNA lysidine(34) synthetase TilS [Isoptericola sp. b408]MDO8152221.1 tRNA lysidine(34) synthetase TilS [Isoptericola sp. b408]
MPRIDPALAAARTAVRADLADLGPDDLLLVACSGGPDSLALAAAVAHEARRVGRSVRSRGYAVRAGAVVVDHGLQPGSDAVAERAAQQCRALGLDPVVVREAAVVGTRDGAEGAARAARYAALEAVAQETGATAVLLGHTLDDQAEQVLLGLARGSGARSLGGMPARRGRYRRPLLGLRRAQTAAACVASGLEPWHDPTNDPDAVHGGPVPLRSAVRGRLLPVLTDVLGPGAVEALARSADQLRDDAAVLDAQAADLLTRALPDPGTAVADEGPDGDGAALVLDVAPLAAAPAALRRRALREAALRVGCPPGTTTARHVDALDALVVRWRGQGEVHLPADVRATRDCGRLFLRPSVTGPRHHAPHPEE